LAPQILVVPAGHRRPVVFQDKAFVPAGQAGFSWTLNAPVLVFSRPWMMVPEAAGRPPRPRSHHRRAARPPRVMCPSEMAAQSVADAAGKRTYRTILGRSGKSCQLAKVPLSRSQ
jgi:hypothetical protein